MPQLSSCYSSGLWDLTFVFMFSIITQRWWWCFRMFNQSHNWNLKPCTHHLWFHFYPLTYWPCKTLMPSFHFSHIPVIYSPQDALQSHRIISTDLWCLFNWFFLGFNLHLWLCHPDFFEYPLSGWHVFALTGFLYSGRLQRPRLEKKSGGALFSTESYLIG